MTKLKKDEEHMHVWYVGYGSNLLRERFNHYILGGKFRWGGKPNNKCRDSTLPKENRVFIIPHRLYFANNSDWWQGNGVAFISPEPDKDAYTYGRMWKITKEQFEHIWKEEGNGKNWYNKKLDLGQENGIPIYTITHSSELQFSTPSDNYVKTIIAGLKETYNLSDEKIIKYLIEKLGVKAHFSEQDLNTICQSIQS